MDIVFFLSDLWLKK